MENSKESFVAFYRMMNNPTVVQEFCLSAIQRVAEAHGLDQWWAMNVNTSEDDSAFAEGACPFTLPDRLSLVHDTGMVDILFARRCFRIFMSSFPQVESLVRRLTDSPDTTVSCIGDMGPSLEYISFLFELREYLWEEDVPISSVVKELNIINWWEEWREMTNAFIGGLAEGRHLGLSSSNVPNAVRFLVDKAICASGAKGEVKEAVSKSDVVLMMDLREEYSRNISEVKALFDILKSGCLVFCLEEPATVDLIDEQVLQQTPGKYLLTPTKVGVEIDLSGTRNRVELRLFRSIVKTFKEGTFFAWQKLAADDNSEAAGTSTDGNIATPNFRTIDAHIERVVEAVASLERTVESVKDASSKNRTDKQ